MPSMTTSPSSKLPILDSEFFISLMAGVETSTSALRVFDSAMGSPTVTTFTVPVSLVSLAHKKTESGIG